MSKDAYSRGNGREHGRRGGGPPAVDVLIEDGKIAASRRRSVPTPR